MKTAMVWGAEGGIGRAVSEELVALDWTVVGLSRSEEATRDVVNYSISVDLSDASKVQRAVQAAAFEVSSVDLWIYTAGDIISTPVEDLSPPVWNRIISANLTGAYLAAHYSLPLLANDAHMFFVGAISERLHLPGLAAYAAAKAGLEAMVDTLRKEQRQRRVSIIRPVAVDTPLWQKVPLKMPRNAIAPSELVVHQTGFDEWSKLRQSFHKNKKEGKMVAKLYRVTLTSAERQELTALVNKGTGLAGKLKRARILLMADEAQGRGWKDDEIVQALHTSRRTVERTREKCVELGVAAAINHTRPKKTRGKVLDGAAEARLVRLACSQAPDGREKWTLQLLADKLIELEVVETVSYETVRTTLKKMNSSLG